MAKSKTEVILASEEGVSREVNGRHVLSAPRNNKNALPALLGKFLTDEEVQQDIETSTQVPSSFGRYAHSVKNLINDQDLGTANKLINLALLQSLLDLIPIAEQKVRSSSADQGIYQYNALISQMRELMVDIQADRDLDTVVYSILHDGFESPFRTFTQMMIKFNTNLKRELKAILPVGKSYTKEALSLVDTNTKDLGIYVEGMWDEIQRRIKEKVESEYD